MTHGILKKEIASVLSNCRVSDLQNSMVKNAINHKMEKLLRLCSESFQGEAPYIVLEQILTKTLIFPEGGEIRFCPDIEEAILYLGPEKAIRLFEDTENLSDLYIKSEIIRHLLAPGSYLYTFDEITNILKDYKSHLEHNKESLIKIGFPESRFMKCSWLDFYFTNLYPTKLPISLYEDTSFFLIFHAIRKNLAETNTIGNPLYTYQWTKKDPLSSLSSIPFPPFNYEFEKEFENRRIEFGQSDYKKASTILGLEEFAENIEILREKIFNIKMKVLDPAISLFHSDNLDDVIKAFSQSISDKLNQDEIDILFMLDSKVRELKIDEYLSQQYLPFLLLELEERHLPEISSQNHYIGSNLNIGITDDLKHLSDNRELLVLHDFDSFMLHKPQWDFVGGLTDIFDIFGFFIEEQKTGIYANTKTNLAKCIPNLDGIYSYYQFIGKANQESVDRALDEFCELWGQKNSVLSKYPTPQRKTNENISQLDVSVKIDITQEEYDKLEPILPNLVNSSIRHIREIEDIFSAIPNITGGIQQNQTQFLFKRIKKNDWKVIYDNISSKLREYDVGLLHIQFLLKNPIKEHKAAEVAKYSSGIASHLDHSEVDFDEIEQSGYTEMEAKSKQQKMDEQAFKESNEKMRLLSQQYQELLRDGDNDRAKEVKKELNTLKKPPVSG